MYFVFSKKTDTIMAIPQWDTDPLGQTACGPREMDHCNNQHERLIEPAASHAGARSFRIR
jgi:hypothetical protein